MNRFITFLIIFLLSVSVYSQTGDGYPALTKKDLPKAKFTRTREFNGESLYGYIDGGADLYLEFGFTKVTVTEFTVKKEKFKAEVWEMKDSESAFGIYSVSKLRCNGKADFTKLSCLNKYQFQICAGQFYISIINESGSTQSQEQSLTAGRILAGQIDGPSYNPAGFFPGIDAETAGNEAKLVKGKLGVVNGFPELEEFFKGSEHCTSLILRSGEKILISMNFENAGYMNEFAGIRKWDMSDISASGKMMAGGELVRKTGENSLSIEIRDNK